MQSLAGPEGTMARQGCPVLMHHFLLLLLQVLYSVQASERVHRLLSYSPLLDF